MSAARHSVLPDVPERLGELEETYRATLNILEDFDEERSNSQLLQRATLNLLEDINEERDRLDETKRALLNMLEDIDKERANSEQARELIESANIELEKYRLHLEELVEQRTRDLEKANINLHAEISRRTQIAEDLARSNKDLEQFAYVASHDLKEPLRAVAGYMGLLKKRFPETMDTGARNYVNQAIEGAERMQTLINDLLTFSRVGTKGGAFKDMSMKEAADMAVSNLRVAIEESGAIIHFDPLPVIAADMLQITQLLQNLLGNAIKFRVQDHPEIRVTARRESRQWVFCVRDNGIGIDPRFFDRIFLIFQRLHTRDEYTGTGIGLALCKKIVERHGGSLWVKSAPGRGSEFYFTLPDREEVE